MHTTRNRRATAKPKRTKPPTVPAPHAMGGKVPSFLLRPVDPPAAAPLRSFPADVLIPPHRGAIARSIELAGPVSVATPGFTPKAKRKPRPKRPGKAARKVPARLAEVPVIALPARPEPLVALEASPSPAPLAPPPRRPIALPPHGPITPLPRRRTLAPWRPAGLAAQLGQWLRDRAAALSRRVAATSAQAPPDVELARLRAENEHLRLQIEALLALRPEPALPPA